jgi:hypothetical protein
MHGGAKGTGAPLGNQNALKHGTYTKEAFRQRRALDELQREVRKALAGKRKEGDV